jgi:hypothetical protein
MSFLGTNTTFVSGNLQKIGIALFNSAYNGFTMDHAARKAMVVPMITVVGTLVGAVSGAAWFFLLDLGNWNLILPAFVQFVCMWGLDHDFMKKTDVEIKEDAMRLASNLGLRITIHSPGDENTKEGNLASIENPFSGAKELKVLSEETPT